MPIGFKVALPNKDINNSNPDNFGLFIDQKQDLILIKQYSQGLTNVVASGTKIIKHGLGYIPFCLIFVLKSGGIWKKMFGADVSGSEIYYVIDKENITITNPVASNTTFQYFIFYDNFQS